jgi:hypothetical protein
MGIFVPISVTLSYALRSDDRLSELGFCDTTRNKLRMKYSDLVETNCEEMLALSSLRRALTFPEHP